MTAAPGPAVRRATAEDRSRMAAVLAGAFTQDPVFTYMFPPCTRRREERLTAFFRLELPRTERLGGAWTSGDGAGAAVWYPPGQWRPSTWEVVRQIPAAVRVFGRRGAMAARAQAVMQEHHPLPPHWYLFYLGTHPQFQGTGIGTALLRPVLEHCDRYRLPAYLEASSVRNRQLYLRHGFQDQESFALPGDGPTLHPMWREPQ
jgi:GNAT superfamily N-acetyltransferase